MTEKLTDSVLLPLHVLDHQAVRLASGYAFKEKFAFECGLLLGTL